MGKSLAWVAILVVVCGGAALRAMAGDSATKPLRQAELLALVAGNALPENVVREIGADGLAFHPDDVYRSLLNNADADATILKAVDAAKVSIAADAEDKANPALLQRLSDAGKLMKDHREEDAARDLSAALQATFQSPESGFVVGEILRREEEWGKAAAVYNEVLREAPDFPEAHTKLSYILYRAGAKKNPFARPRPRWLSLPTMPKPIRTLGWRLKAYKFDAAVAEYKEALRIEPDYAAVRYDLGNLLREKGDFDEAIVEYRKAITLDPNESGAHSNLGLALEKKGNLDGAIREFREAKRLDPKSFDARADLASTLSEHGMYTEAVREYRELQDMFPDSEVCHKCLADALFRTWDFDGAEKEYRKAIEMDPSDHFPHVGLGGIREEQKNYEAALQEYRRAEKLDDTSVDAHRGAGRILLTKKDYPGAIEELKRAENLKPSDAGLHDLLGQAFEESGNIGAAANEFGQSVELDPRQIQVRIKLAAALEKKGDWAAAIAEYRKAALADASIDLRGKTGRTSDRDAQREYKEAQQRLNDHLSTLRATGKSAEASSLETRIHSVEAAPSLSEKLDANLQAGLAAVRERHFDEALGDFKEAVELAEKIQPHDQRLLAALDYLGNASMGQDWPGAQKAFERELQVAEELFGPQSQAAAAAIESLGNNALVQKDYGSAEKFYFRAVDINEKIFGEGSDRVAASLMSATRVYVVQKQYDKAEPYLLRAVHIDESLYGADNVGMLIPLSNLCGLYDHWGKPDKSAACDQRLLTVLEKQYGVSSPVLVTTLSSESQALRGLGRTDEAEKVDRRLALIRAATMKPN